MTETLVSRTSSRQGDRDPWDRHRLITLESPLESPRESAGELRVAFDRTFADAPVAAVPQVDVLAIRAGGKPYAIAQAQLAALRVDLAVVALPSPSPALLGVASLHGQILPVWDLGRLAHGEPVRGLRWCAVVRGGAAVVAFDRLDRYLRIDAPVGRAVVHAGVTYAVLDLAGLLAERTGAA